MLTVAPRGSTKLLRCGLMPARAQHWIVTGRVATEEEVPKAVMRAWGREGMTAREGCVDME